MDKEKWLKRRLQEDSENPPTEEEWKLYLAEMKDWRLPLNELEKKERTEEVQQLINSYSPEAFQEIYFRKLASKRRIREMQEEQKKKFAHLKLETPEKKEDTRFLETFKKVCYGIGKEGRHFSTKQLFKIPDDDLIYVFHSPERKEADCVSRADLYRSFLSKEVTEWKGERRPLVSLPNDKLPPMWVVWTDDFKDSRYFAFELQKPELVQIGSSFGVSSLHGAKELVYEVEPIESNDPSISELAKIPRRKDTSYLNEFRKENQFKDFEDALLDATRLLKLGMKPLIFDEFIIAIIDSPVFEESVPSILPTISKFFDVAAKMMTEDQKRMALRAVSEVFYDRCEIYFKEEIKIYDALAVTTFGNLKIGRRDKPGMIVKFNPNVDLLNFKGAENVYNAIFQGKDISEMRLDVTKKEFLRVAKLCAIPNSKIWYDLLPTMSIEEIRSVSKLYRNAVPPLDLFSSNYPHTVLTKEIALHEYISPYYVNQLAPFLNDMNEDEHVELNVFVIDDETLEKLNKKALRIVLRACFNRSRFLKRYERQFLDRLQSKFNVSEFEQALLFYIRQLLSIDDFSDEVLYYLSLKRPDSGSLKTLIDRRKVTSMKELSNKERNKALKNLISKNPELVEAGGMNTLFYLNQCLGPKPTTKAQKDKEKILLDHLNSL